MALSYLKSYRKPIAVALAFMLTELAVELLQPFFISKIIDHGIVEKNIGAVVSWGAMMLGMALIGFLSGISNSFFSSYVSQYFGYDLRMLLYEKIQSFSYADMHQFQTSSLVTRMTNDVTQIQNTVFSSLRIMLRAPLLVLGSVVMVLIVNWKLGIVIVALTPFAALFLLRIKKMTDRLFRTVQRRLDRVNEVLRENLAAMRLIRAFNRSDYENGRFTKANGNLRDKTKTVLQIIEISGPVLLFVMNLGILTVLWLGNIQLLHHQVQIGEVVAIVNYGFRITGSISMFSMIISNLSRAKASLNRVDEVLHADVTQTDADGDGTDGAMITQGQIEFKHVSFHYPGTNKPVLKDISFIVRPKEKIAVLGATGSGKTTLFQLIPRLYDVESGEILIDGQPISKMKLQALRSQIGYAPQESILFSGTIQENLKWGKRDAEEVEWMQAAKNAQIYETISELPQHFETLIGQKGVNFSGGQKQRLSIARALIRRPKILLLDDSTSALDLKTEAKLLQALETYDCTVLMITQKISTAMAAGQILLLDDGKVVAYGPHAELLRTSSLYREICRSQFGREEKHHA